MEVPASQGVEIVPSRAAPVGTADPSRRWALATPGGFARFHGVTRPEAEAAIPALAAAGHAAWEELLVQVALPVVLSDGAGPYLLDFDGRVTLVLGPHPAIDDAHVAMGEPAPLHRMGLVRPAGRAVWRWLASAHVGEDGRVGALDGLAACDDLEAARGWAVSGRG
ncbi:hypothetical protein [Miltoncostaea marina]|uniref:hypothetical protein n=1 Tax=Miltoncostaea marina TaxID=2843215 RepID=UPI001C3E46B7|nr:hypothetical protein [Miltoncostaea marina]